MRIAKIKRLFSLHTEIKNVDFETLAIIATVILNLQAFDLRSMEARHGFSQDRTVSSGI